MKTRNGFLLIICFIFIFAVPGLPQEFRESEMKVKRVMMDPYSNSPVVILEALADKRVIPIWIDVPEAKAIALELEHVETPRPLTHDLIRNILQGIGATLHRITITDLKNNTYFALLTLKLRGRDIQIDSRPSDAIAVALRMKAPIYASAQVLAKAKQLPEANKTADALRTHLGIQAQDLTSDLAGLLDLQVKRGILVADVVLGGPGATAGLQRGDIITRANDRVMQRIEDLEGLLQAHKDKDSRRLKMDILRKGKPTTVVIDLPS